MSWFSSKWSQFKNWYKTSILQHGESDNISDRTGMSESDMSGELSEVQWKKYIDSLPANSPFRKWLDRHDGRLVFKDKQSPFRTNAAKIMAAIGAALTGNYLGAGSAAASVGSDVLGDPESSRGAGSWNSLNWFKSLFSDKESFNLTGLLSGLTGIGTELGSSILNYQNQVKLIDKQNEYNTPAAQMQRFLDAGLNPNLVYGLGSNGNQPASGSIAPVDFSTAQRESKMAMLNYRSDLAQKQASINLMDKQASEADERAKAQRLSNNTFMQSWYMDMSLKSMSIKQVVNSINNDNIRTQFQKELSEAQKKLAEFQSQPRYMQELGSVDEAMNYISALIDNIMQRINQYIDEHPRGVQRIIRNGNDDSWRNMGKPFTGSPNGL